MHFVWVYIFFFIGLVLVFSFSAYIKNVDQSIIFGNAITWLICLVSPLLYFYLKWQYPDSGYEGVIRMIPMGSGTGMIIVSISLLAKWFKWDDKYENIFPLIESIHSNRKSQLALLASGIFLVSVQLFLDFFIRK